MDKARQRLAALQSEMRALYATTLSGRALAVRHAAEVDGLLHGLWRAHARKAREKADLVAVGGYGRGELAPFSDWDIWIVWHAHAGKEDEEEIARFIQALWDLGAKIGHRIGSARALARAFSEDLHAVTAAMEARLVAGTGAGFAALAERVRAWLARHRDDFVRAKIAEFDVRHAKEGALGMEPNIKESVGGLRDAQTVFWIARALAGEGELFQMVAKGLLFAREFDELREAESFLWRVRIGLHWLVGRAQEVLSFEAQHELAQKMGFADGERPAVEAFMRAYFRRAGRIARIAGLFVEDVRARLAPRRLRSRPVDDAFARRGEELVLVRASAFREDPVRLVVAFGLAAAHGLRPASTLLRRAREDVHLIDEEVRRDARARAAFLDILRRVQGAGAILRAMHATGVLGRFIPEFRPAVGLGQFNRYHAWPVDEHALRAVEEAERLLRAETAVPHGEEASAVIARPDVLLLAALFHDLGKAAAGDHSETGARLARACAERLGLHEDSAALVEWLVAKHLLMSETAQRMDIADPEIVRRFADEVGDEGRLAYLYLLTIADIRAVSPRAWTPWRAALLGDLYEAARAHLALGAGRGLAERLALRRRTALALSGLSKEEAERLLGLFAPEVAVRIPPRRLARALALLAEGKETGACLWHDAEYGETVACVVARDRPGLFADLATALANAGLSIADAQAEPLQDGRVLDLFVVARSRGGPLVPEDFSRLRARLLEAVQSSPKPRRMRLRADILMRRVPVRVRRRPEAASRAVAVEVSAADRPGLLAALARAIHAEGWGIRSAKASTLGERAVDVFFLEVPSGTSLDAAWPRLARALEDAARLPEESA